MGCATSKQVEPTQPGPGPIQRPKTEAGAGAQATAEAQAMGSSPLLLRDEQLDATILHSAVCRPSTTRPFVRCRAGSANLPASWWTYPRWSMLDSVGKPWVMHNMSTVQVLPGAASCNGTTALHDFALLIPAMWGHTYHFYVEWLYHLLVFSRRRAAAPTPPQSVTLLPVPMLPSRALRLTPYQLGLVGKLFDLPPRLQLSTQVSPDRAAALQRGLLAPVCIRRAQLGLRSTMDVSVMGSSCLQLRQWSTSDRYKCDASFNSPLRSAYWRAAQAFTNCTGTIQHFHYFRQFASDGFVKRLSRRPSAPKRVLLVNRNSRSRALQDVSAFARGLHAALREHSAEIVVTDFDSNQARTNQLMADADALVAVHGNALTNPLLGLWPSLRAVVQLYPECMPLQWSPSAHAYAVIAHLATGRRCDTCHTLCCACATAADGKSSNVTCDPRAVAASIVQQWFG